MDFTIDELRALSDYFNKMALPESIQAIAAKLKAHFAEVDGIAPEPVPAPEPVVEAAPAVDEPAPAPTEDAPAA